MSTNNNLRISESRTVNSASETVSSWMAEANRQWTADKLYPPKLHPETGDGWTADKLYPPKLHPETGDGWTADKLYPPKLHQETEEFIAGFTADKFYPTKSQPETKISWKPLQVEESQPETKISWKPLQVEESQTETKISWKPLRVAEESTEQSSEESSSEEETSKERGVYKGGVTKAKESTSTAINLSYLTANCFQSIQTSIHTTPITTPTYASAFPIRTRRKKTNLGEAITILDKVKRNTLSILQATKRLKDIGDNSASIMTVPELAAFAKQFLRILNGKWEVYKIWYTSMHYNDPTVRGNIELIDKFYKKEFVKKFKDVDLMYSVYSSVMILGHTDLGAKKTFVIKVNEKIFESIGDHLSEDLSTIVFIKYLFNSLSDFALQEIALHQTIDMQIDIVREDNTIRIMHVNVEAYKAEYERQLTLLTGTEKSILMSKVPLSYSGNLIYPTHRSLPIHLPMLNPLQRR